LSSQCASGFPVTQTNSSTCASTGDGLGNAGFWLVPGAYIYCLSGPNITGKCYNLTVPVGATASGGAVLSQANVVRDCRLDGLIASTTVDQGPAINTCLANAYANQQDVSLPCGQFLVTTPINDTNKPALNVTGCGAAQAWGTSIAGQNFGTVQTQLICNTRATGSGICWDATGSGAIRLKDFALCND